MACNEDKEMLLVQNDTQKISTFRNDAPVECIF